jgi:ketosteroid isomerase-like protein
MSQENVELVRRGFRTFETGDRTAFMALLQPEVVWYPAMELLLEQSSYHGPDAVCRLLFEEIPSVLEGFTSELLGVHDLGGDAVLAVVKFKGRAVSAGMTVEQVFGQVFRARDGKAVEMRSYPSKAEALEAVGLRE